MSVSYFNLVKIFSNLVTMNLPRPALIQNHVYSHAWHSLRNLHCGHTKLLSELIYIFCQLIHIDGKHFGSDMLYLQYILNYAMQLIKGNVKGRGRSRSSFLIGGACKCNTWERPSQGHGFYVRKYIDLTKNRGGLVKVFQ